MKIPDNFKFVAYDGDGIGRKVGRAILANDLDELRHISHLIEAGHSLVQRWIKDRDGIWINGGGDEGNAAVSGQYIEDIEQLRKDYEYLVGATISVGVGKTPSEAGRALLIAKLKGKNQTVEFGEQTEKDIKDIKKRAKKGAFKSMEEYKLAGAYLGKNENSGHEECPYCLESEGVDPDHCKYCHDAEAQAEEETCPYCKGSQNDPSQGPKMPEVAEQDCSYCKEMDEKGKEECTYCAEESIAPNAMNPSPDSHSDIAPAGSDKEKDQYAIMGMAPPEIGKPNPDEEPPIGQNAPMDVNPMDNDQALESPQPSGLQEPRTHTEGGPAIDPEDNHSRHALTSIAKEIEHGGNPPESEVNAVDDSQMIGGNNSEGNVSRPEGFGQNIPGDMGMGGTNPPTDNPDEDLENEEPDFSGVLEEGLNRHADGIQREKVVRMASQALMQFKASKQSLENIKTQAPDLYQSSLAILKAMIEMASLLNLGQGVQPTTQLGDVQESLTPPPEEQNDEWHDPFPTHPDQGGTPKPGHSPSKSAGLGGKEKPDSPQQ